MAASEVAVGMIFLLQTVVGALGNFSLMYHYLLRYCMGCRLKHTDLILKHLFIANFFTLFCKGVPQTMTAFGMKGDFSDFVCKLLFYLHRQGRGVSIGSTCLLSIFQAITINPTTVLWAKLKAKFHRCLGPSIYMVWILYLLVNIACLVKVTSKQDSKNMTSTRDFGYCSSVRFDKIGKFLHLVLVSFPDILCVGLMLWASSFMVLILYRHRQRMKHVPRTSVSLRFCHESRATKTILLLVSTFVCFYTLSCIFQICLVLIYHPSRLLVDMTAITSMCFPTVSPFLFLGCDSNASSFFYAWIRNRKRPNIVSNIEIKLGVVVDTFNPSTREAEVGGSK